jgi:hypothetical protein
MPARAQDAPIWIQPDVMARHRIAGEIRFRSTGTERRIADPIPLDAIVDESGRVASVGLCATAKAMSSPRSPGARAGGASRRCWRLEVCGRKVLRSFDKPHKLGAQRTLDDNLP